MKLNITIIFIFLTFNLSAQNLNQNEIIGLWQVQDTSLEIPKGKNLENEKVETITKGFIGATIAISKDNLFKMTMIKKNALGSFSDEMFSNVYNYTYDPNNGQLLVGGNIMNLLIYQKENLIYFNLGGPIELQVVKIKDTVTIKGKVYEDKNIPKNQVINNNKENIQEELSEAEVIPFALVDEIPISKDCKPKWKKEKLKKCVIKSMNMHIVKKFNTDLAATLGLTGRIKITSTFIINTEGIIVNITTKSPHEDLTKEAIRVINSMPKMIPAKHKGIVVPVKYSLPIVFQIQD